MDVMSDPGSTFPVDGKSLDAPSSSALDDREGFESARLAIYVSRPDGRLVACNAEFASLLGFMSVADAIGTSMTVLYDEAVDRERFVASVRDRGLLERHPSRLRRRDGGVVDVIETVVGDFDAAGVLTELRGFVIEVTAGVEPDPAHPDREQQFRSVFMGAADAMLVLDDRRRILDANAAAATMLAAGADTLVGRSLDALIVGGEDQLAEPWRELLALGEARREHRVRPHAGQTRLVECSYRARVHAAGYLWIARDITDRRLLEQRLVQSEKMESVGRLAGGIAHDFNNLLTAILGYAELLLSDRSESDPDRHDLEEIQKAGQRAADLTQQLLAFSRKQVLMPKDVDLNHTIVSLQTMLSRLIREDIILSCDLAPEPAVIRIDPTQLEQVIVNLVLNARDALPAGGHIRLEVGHVPRSQMEMLPDHMAAVGDYVRLRVVDDGVGISPEARAHLFEPFFTTKEVGKGTGLGLASVYGIVRQSHGFIAVESHPGTGSVFTMHFPSVPRVEDVRIAGGLPAGAAAGRQTILLVEDEDAVRLIVSAVLRRQGHHVLEASTPRAACEIFAERGEEIGLLLTDVVMPEMNGPALAQRLVGLRPELRVLFMSGYAHMVTIDGENPNVSFLSKPFQVSVLAERVRQMLARPARARADG
jgi:two-component system, cell cycle sensor histidine kinase and response regulator CckA